MNIFTIVVENKKFWAVITTNSSKRAETRSGMNGEYCCDAENELHHKDVMCIVATDEQESWSSKNQQCFKTIHSGIC